MSLLLFLASLTATEFGTSPLIDPDHQHDWVPLSEDHRGAMWWDRNSISTHAIEDTDYPTLIMRAHFVDESIPFTQLDMHIAIDCDGNRIANIEVFGDGTVLPEPARMTMDPPRFESLPGPNEDTTQTMMRAVCGEDWTL